MIHEQVNSRKHLLSELARLRQRLAAYEEPAPAAAFSTRHKPVEGFPQELFESPIWVQNLNQRRSSRTRKRGSLKIQLPDKHLRTVFEAAPVGISVATDTSCRVIRHNPEAARFLRINPGESFSCSAPVPPPVKILFRGKELPAEKMPIQRAAWYGETTKDLQLEFIWEDGVKKFSSWSASPLYSNDGEVIGAIGTFEDITEHKQMEDALRESEEKYRALAEKLRDVDLPQSEERFTKAFSSNPAAMAIIRFQDNVILSVNDSFIKLFGHSSEELIGRNANELQVGATQKERTRIKEILQQNGRLDNYEMKYRKKTGESGVGLISYSIIELKGEACLIGSLIDITERKRAECALRESEERFHTIFHNSPDIINIVRMEDDRYVEVNRKFTDVLGYRREEVLGRTPKEIAIRVEEESYYEPLYSKLSDQGRLYNFESQLRTRSGRTITTLCSSELINLNGEICRLTVKKDITKEKRLETEMARLDRLGLVGEMAASIGHEIRNPMTTIRGFLQMINERDDTDKYREYYQLMIEELDRANNIITEYLSMARDKSVDLRPGWLNSIVKALSPLLQAAAQYEDKQLKLALGQPPKLLFDEKEIRQLILNLARNGLEAMPPGGTLTIGTQTKKGEAVLFIKDEGSGLDPMVLDKLGTPFVTTKENGTGLGLAVCYSIAQRHNAHIKVDTGPGGTTFTVQFESWEKQQQKNCD